MRPLLRSFGYAFAGISYVIRTQRNMRIHLAIGSAVAVAGLGLRISSIEWAIIFVATGVVFAAETLNTVVESLVDLASPDLHPLAKITKDAAAGAVMLTALAASGAGIVIFGPRVLALFWH